MNGHFLTPRELEIFKLLIQNETTKTIADKLHISDKTVRNHISNVIGKLGVTSRTQAIITVSNPLAKGMSWLKTNAKLSLKESDATIADLITDGCNMGVKFLHRYLNQYKAADEISKNLIKRLINIEEKLAIEIRVFL